MKRGRERSAQKAVSGDLKVRVDRIGDDGLELDEALSHRWIDEALGRDTRFHARVDGRLRLHLHKVEHVVYVRGRANLDLMGACVRCLGPIALALDVPVEVALFPRGEEPPAAPDGELDAEDMGVASYDDGIVDLAGVVHDEVFLELPMNPLCSESCAGLCLRCGTNLNEARCACAPETDPRWQGLHDLKVD
jgi:uncharacterized protein